MFQSVPLWLFSAGPFALAAAHVSLKLLSCAGFLSGAGGSEGALQHFHNFQKGIGKNMKNIGSKSR